MDWKNSLKALQENCTIGEDIYWSLVNGCPENSRVIVSPGHIGDTVYVASYVRAYKEYYRCSKVLFVVTDYLVDMVSMFPSIDIVFGLEQNEMESLKCFVFVNSLWHENNLCFMYLRGSIMVERGIAYYYFSEEIKRKNPLFKGMENGRALICMDLPFDSKPEKFDPDRSDPGVLSMGEFYRNAVLLVPTAYSVDMIEKGFWEKLAEFLKGLGFDVYTNYNGRKDEYIIKGTHPLQTGLKEIAVLGQFFKAIVGIRCGLCNLLAETPANLIVIYPDEHAVDLYDIDDLIVLRGNSEGIAKVIISENEQGLDKEIEIIKKLICN